MNVNDTFSLADRLKLLFCTMSTQIEQEDVISALQSFFHLKIVLQLRIHSCILSTSG